MAYDAFISYSQGQHSSLARALQEGMQSVGKRWEQLASMRVFRDETQLHVGRPLSSAISKALDESAFFILLASPEAAQSDWVKFELKSFLATHSPENVLVVLVGGQLTWNETIKDYNPSPSSAFPNLGRGVFTSQPLHLDLQWVTPETPLSLSNPRFRNAVATLAAALRDVSVKTVLEALAEEQVRLRRNQRINLTFRGVVGYGLGALLGIGIDGYVRGDILSAINASLLSCAVVGCVGALVLGLGWRGLVGSGLGFILLTPLYILSGLSPHPRSPGEWLIVFFASVLGFGLAGALSTSFTKNVRWYDGSISFSVGGIAAVLLWLAFPAWRYNLQTSLIGPWQLSRLHILISSVLHDGQLSLHWAPLAAAVTVGGLLLGWRLANRKIAVPLKERRPTLVRIAARILKPSQLTAYVVFAFTLTLALLVYSLISSTSTFQVRYASNELRAELFGDSVDRDLREPEDWRLVFRLRGVLLKEGQFRQSQGFSRILETWIDRYAEGGYTLYEHFDRVDEIAKIFVEFGSRPELSRMLQKAEKRLVDTKTESRSDPVECDAPYQLIKIGEAWSIYGDLAARERSYSEAAAVMKKHPSDRATSEIAGLLAENGEITKAKEILRPLLERTNNSLEWDLSRRERVAFLLVQSGRWKELSEWNRKLRLTVPLVAELSRAKNPTEAMSLFSSLEQSDLANDDISPAVRAAFDSGYDASAVAMLNRLGSQTGTDRNSRINAMEKVAKLSRNDGLVKAKIVPLLMAAVEERLASRKSNPPFSIYDADKEVADILIALAAADEWATALRYADTTGQSKTLVYLEIASALIRAHRLTDAHNAIILAWKTTYEDYGLPQKTDGPLVAIGDLAAQVGDLRGARFVADDFLPGAPQYSRSKKSESKYIGPRYNILCSILEQSLRQGFRVGVGGPPVAMR